MPSSASMTSSERARPLRASPFADVVTSYVMTSGSSTSAIAPGVAASQSAQWVPNFGLVTTALKFVSVVIAFVRNRPPKAVRCCDGGVVLNRFLVWPEFWSTSLVLNTVLIAGRPIWSAAIQDEPSHQDVVPHTPMFVPPIASSGTSITSAFVLSGVKKSVGLLPNASLPTPRTVPRKPVRSKKNGSLRTPAKTFAPPLAVPMPDPLVQPDPICTPTA